MGDALVRTLPSKFEKLGSILGLMAASLSALQVNPGSDFPVSITGSFGALFAAAAMQVVILCLSTPNCHVLTIIWI